jgi:hypothetical protein
MSQQWMNPPTRYPSGLTNQIRKSLFGGWPGGPVPMTANVYFNDFNTYTAADWSETKTNSGTIALQAVNGGSLLVTTGATATNDAGSTLATASFAITPGYRAWFGISFTVSDIASANSPSFILGLTKGGPSAPTDGVYFTKASGANKTVSAVIRASSTSSTITGIATLADATQYTLGWFYNGAATGTLSFYSSSALTAAAAFSSPNPISGAEVTAASGDSSYAAPNVLTNLPAPTTVMAPEFYIVAPGTTAPTLAVDWIFAAAELARP